MRFRRLGLVAFVLAGGVIVAVLLAQSRWRSRTAPVLGFQIVHQYPHDPHAYCQGLVIDRGVLYEGTGQYGQSSLRIVDLPTGKVLQRVDLPKTLFGEGVAVWREEIIQLTWKKRHALVYDRKTLEQQRQLAYRGEGWGLTHDGRRLIMSNGTATLRFVDPDDFRTVRTLTVHDGARRISNLNELEYIDGIIYANVWQTDRIAKIDPRTGRVVAWLDLANLYPQQRRADPDAVLNGIAYDAESQRLFVTGKNWPTLYEIKERRR